MATYLSSALAAMMTPLVSQPFYTVSIHRFCFCIRPIRQPFWNQPPQLAGAAHLRYARYIRLNHGIKTPLFERSIVRAALNRSRQETFARLKLPRDQASPVQPGLILPPDLRAIVVEHAIGRPYSPHTERLHRARGLAYSDVEAYSFSIRYEAVCYRLKVDVEVREGLTNAEGRSVRCSYCRRVLLTEA